MQISKWRSPENYNAGNAHARWSSVRNDTGIMGIKEIQVDKYIDNLIFSDLCT